MTNPRPRSSVGTDVDRLAAQGMADGDVFTAPTDTWANVFGGLTANSTDLAAASSQLCRVGP